MRTANAMQPKKRINSKAREAGIPPQTLMQNYFIERFLVQLMAYPLETVLTEKPETVVPRKLANTRPRDFYDILMQKAYTPATNCSEC